MPRLAFGQFCLDGCDDELDILWFQMQSLEIAGERLAFLIFRMSSQVLCATDMVAVTQANVPAATESGSVMVPYYQCRELKRWTL